ncbi:hypothetical protein Ahy_B06g083822 [Arachis hypogaea]|uniref:Uncharacterized protein n=1 Tax=Arachis hypogaea TaxID=3818 RepID=A0A444YQG7_ARAHY|nr:hypothetical protein Ahy_B06g083822 [Arachis hypogaea]
MAWGSIKLKSTLELVTKYYDFIVHYKGTKLLQACVTSKSERLYQQKSRAALSFILITRKGITRTSSILRWNCSGTCTVREAIYVGSIIEGDFVPPLVSSCDNNYSYFMKILLEKEPDLRDPDPDPAVNALMDHFMRFLTKTRQLPVLWHRSLLAFVNRSLIHSFLFQVVQKLTTRPR